MTGIRKRTQLLRRREALLDELKGLGNLMRGSLRVSQVRAKPGAKPAPQVHLSVTIKGRSRSAYVGEGRAAEVQALIDEYHRAKALIEELTITNLELLRPTTKKKRTQS